MTRAYTTGRFALEIESNRAGWVHTVEGGNRVAEVVTEKSGGEMSPRKHVSQIKFEDITMCCGLGMSKSLYNWIKHTVDFDFDRRNGSVVACDFNNKERWRMEFYNALVAEVGFPAVDAASKDAAKLTLKFSPEWTKTSKGSGTLTQSEHPTDDKKGKQWLANCFRLDIDGLGQACKHAMKVEAMVIKQKITDHSSGEREFPNREPTGLEFPNLVVTVPEAHAEEVWKWEKDFLLRGKSTSDFEKTATLEYLSSNKKNVLFTVTMTNVGLFKVTTEKLESGADKIRMVKFEMYVEQMDFRYESGATMA